jgi:hypothetical protein
MIRLKSIQIGNFRGIREGAVRDFADVNILVGRNNSGKSTIVEAIHRLADTAGGDAGDPISRRSGVWVETRSEPGIYAPELWYRLIQTEAITLRAEVGGVSGPSGAILTLTIRQGGGGPSTSSGWDWGQVPDAGRAELQRFCARTTVFRALDLRNVEIERRLWQKTIGPRHDKALTTALNTIFNQDAEGYSLLNDKLWVLFPHHGVPLDSQGEGNRAAMRCLMMLAVLQKTMFIAEEVECHQHPGSLERFARAVCRMAYDREVQLFLSTHSRECVLSFLKAAAEVGSEAAVFHLKLDIPSPFGNRLLVVEGMFDACPCSRGRGVDC